MPRPLSARDMGFFSPLSRNIVKNPDTTFGEELRCGSYPRTMAPVLKRKDAPTNESFLRTKKVRAEEGDLKSGAAKKNSEVLKISKAKDEEAAFPRGGASVLTPLEHKQIQIEATNDALFEQGGRKKSRNAAGGDPEEHGEHVRRKNKTKGASKKATKDEDEITIESLNYKASLI